MEKLSKHRRVCRICGNACSVNRETDEQRGICGAPPQPHVAWHGLHLGEEPPISGDGGCANIFFAGCNLKCVYCQNWQISQQEITDEKPLSSQQLADLFLTYQDSGAQSLGLVSPSPHLLTLIPALEEARRRGLTLPVVYNTGSYEMVEALAALDGLVDIYLPDLKYGSSEAGAVYSGVLDYVGISRAAVLEMFRQVGHLQLDEKGRATRGLLVRHMVLPGDHADSTLVLDWLARNLGKELHLSIMSQYKPHHMVDRGFFPELARPLTSQEYNFVLDYALGRGFKNIYFQSPDAKDSGNPDFTSQTPFNWES
jgi:putative pyruvate formate lyase activating enzyme